MTTYTITTAQNMSQLTTKGGADTYNINGGTLTIDSDTRYSPNATTLTGPSANINISATLGGSLIVSGANARLVPYSAASGNVPASGTIIAQGAVTAELMCVMATRVGGTVTLAGSAFPTTGWIKIRNLVGGSFAAGAFTAGIVATATAEDEMGWIEVCGVETYGVSAPRLGTWTMAGEWFYLGTTTGSRGQTIQLPNLANLITDYPGVEIETAPSSGVYRFWGNAQDQFTSVNLSTDTRSRFVGITANSLMIIGTGFDSQPTGDLPPGGCRIRIPNIILTSAPNANRTINATPSSTMGTRYETLTASAGVCNFSKITGSWYINLTQCYSVTLLDVHTCDQMVLTECSTPPTVNGLHVGMSYRTTQLASNAIVWAQLYVGGNVSNITALRAQAISTSGYVATFTNLYGGWTISNIRATYAQDAVSISGPIFINTCDDITLNDIEIIGKRMLMSACKNFAVNRITYADNIKMQTPSTAPSHVLEVMSNSKNGAVNTISNWPGVANVHPYNGVVYVNTTFDTTFRNIGSADVPFNAGTTNLSSYLYSDGGNNSRVRFQRNWITGCRTGLFSSTNTSTQMTIDNCYTVDASKTQAPQVQNSYTRGNRQNGGTVPITYTAVYGTHFWDAFTSDTTARLAIAFTEKTLVYPSNASYVVNSGNPRFTSQGSLVATTVGDSVTWTWAYAILGWSGLATFGLSGTNMLNHSFEYDLDKGNGFSGVFKPVSNANLAAETGISPTVGFIPKIRMTVTTTAASNKLDSFSINGTTTLALQNAALYPLDTATLSVTGLLTGSTVAVFVGSSVITGQVPVASVTGTGTSTSLSYVFNPSIPTYTVRIRKAGYDCIALQYANIIAPAIPVSQQLNQDGFGVPVYTRGSGATAAFVTIDASALRVDIGNTRCEAEDVYDAVAAWQATPAGITYPEVLRFDGTDLLMLGSWRFRRALAAYTAAGIDAVPVIEGNPTGSPDDETNGSVDFRARSVRTYQFNAAPALTADDVADAVWNFAQGNGATAESNLRAARAAAENSFAVSA
jgi:hypothetical protein